ncbi:uncharacterized protein MICPUCDRAFT_16138 [Micromonas pusilla CCMP1545]|uniref:Predicted protein n=1 Tax=Micromonas pusilla (strain CCMP1545) TaxID=564608 RepID=C1MR62_MICPC|nr:uncharacterized protein MICPUCDRAFT_16138 [Micromonas pusilla CCMP1545]EEH58200.1 predicted protein [Micromonas pusilla CCMP1545]|mmetsp:Transcript_1970/g.6412  ORF Transcript_1970/g.6412 Transcript_1970/m.6412 type:complete len:87 (+) Transcript_1970:552-812(+)|eukprot:XP_003058249.1 predicted protein [Micromonas pusilla CCMP1545]
MVSKEEFDKAAEEVKAITKCTNDEQLELYGWFKQANVGDCNIARPGMFDPKGKAKWDAWDKCKGVSSEEAMKNYVELVESLKAKYA